MIYTERKIMISNSGASIDSPIILYRGDKEIEILFTIVDSKFKFSSEKGNYIINTGAKFAQLAVDLPDGTDLFTDISECLDGAVLFKITGDMIDEISEIGFYSFHIRLFDESRKSRITIPPVLKGIEIKSPMVTESTVGYATADNSRVDDNEESFIDEDGKLTIEWKKGDVISSVKLNQMVEVVNNAVDEEKQRQQNELVRQNNEEIRQDAIEYAVETYDMTINELNSEKNKIKPYVDDILESAISEHVIKFTEVEGPTISELSFDGYLKDIEILGNTIQNQNDLADIRSVGDKLENQELYEIPVLSTGKNLWGGFSEIKNTNMNPTTGIETTDTTRITTSKIKVKPNTKYRLTISGLAYNIVWYNSKNEITRYLTSATILDTNNDECYIRFTGRKNDSTTFTVEEFKNMNIQLEEGTQATQFEEHQEHKLTILSPVQLEKVGDVADRIICKDGVWGVEKHIVTKIFDGNENWIKESADLTNTVLFGLVDAIDITPIVSNFELGLLISDRFKTIQASSQGSWGTDVEGISLNANNRLHIRISKSKLISYASGTDFKNWLNSNNTLIKYITTQPQFIPLPYDQQIKIRTYANKTNIQFECEIEPTLKASVPKSIGATVNTHSEQIDNLCKELDRVKKLEESTVSIVTTESNFTTVENTSNGYFEDVKLEGRTLVNLYPKLDANNYSSLGVTLSNDTITINANGSWRNFMLKKDVMPLKTSTYYTFVIYIIDNTITGNDPIIHFGDTLPKDPSKFRDSYHFSLKNKKGIYAFKLKTKDSFDNVSIDTRDHLTDKATSGTIVFKYMILEGDHTQNPPEYFEGIKSVGQDVDEISVLTQNNEETKEDKKRILYYNDETQQWGKPILREWDSIEKHSDGKYYYHKRSGEVVLDGSHSSSMAISSDRRDIVMVTIDEYIKADSILINDKKTQVKYTDAFEEKIIGDYIMSYDQQNRNYIAFCRPAGSNELEKELQANPVTVVYQLAEEKVYECTNLDLITYTDETNLMVKSGVLNPKVSLKVSKGVGNVVTMLQNKVTMLEQMVYNLMKMLNNQQSNIDE